MSESHYDTEKVSAYYDTFSKYQTSSGINDRHARILKWLKSFGLNKGDHVLEVGCGVGQLTQLTAEYVRNGSVTGVDISAENIRLAGQRLAKFSNVELLVSDMMDISFQRRLDWVIFPDVLEHIPADAHHQIFTTVADALNPGGHIFVHIPHPKYQDHIREHEPEKLQIIDQSLSAADLIQQVEQVGLSLEHFQSYSLFRRPADYQAILFKKHDGVPTPVLKPYWQRVIQRLRLRGLRS
jgi:cyclopropane fatty-acyl-phospholipid synthase-like methyltransferase